METNNLKNNSRVLTGVFLVAAGLLLFAHKLGAPVPEWIFTWPVAMIAIGLIIGIRHRFTNPVWIILVVIGLLKLVGQIRPDLNFDTYIAPLIILLIGIFFIIRPSMGWGKHRHHWQDEGVEGQQPLLEVNTTANKNYDGDYIDSISVFGGIKKRILSKQFKGGEVTCFMGGAEIDLTQSDIQTLTVLEVTQVFGGTKIMVPANWNIKSEVVAVFAGIEDKRPAHPANINPEKILILRGTTIFGGIDIRSY